MTKVVDGPGNQTVIEYDILGRKLRLHDPDMAGSGNANDAAYWWTYSYDIAGNLISQTDAKGQVIEFAYDPLNRLVRKYYAMDWVSSITAGSSKPSV